jgi:uncharacterized protein DUF6602
MRMIAAHMNAMEELLLQQKAVTANSGHNLHKGSPREEFVRTFLRDHIGENLGIGTGEIINCHSETGQPRNQQDIIIYRLEYPKLYFGGGIDAFLAESVVATIEVKSELTQEKLEEAIVVANRTKALQRFLLANPANPFQGIYRAPSILSYVVAYGGPANMSTVHGWLEPIHQSHGIRIPTLPATGGDRQRTANASIDGVFVLGVGALHFDNAPIGWVHDDFRNANPGMKWVYYDVKLGSLLMLFLDLITAGGGLYNEWLDTTTYLEGVTQTPHAGT